MREIITPYSEIREFLLTGDVILASGRSPVSQVIKVVTWSDISHLATVYILDGNIFVWESTSLGKGVDGVRMTLMSEWVAQYNGKVKIRHLRYDRDEVFYQAYKDTRQDFKGKKYEQNFWELAGSAMPWKNKDNLTTIYCAELKSEVDMRSGVLPRHKPTYLPANEVTPADYLPGRMIDSRLRYNEKPCCFSELKRIK